jgi:phosphate transport system substrate-binding protein
MNHKEQNTVFVTLEILRSRSLGQEGKSAESSESRIRDMKFRATICALLLGLFLTIRPATGEVVIRVAGSETMKEFGQRLADWYAKKTSGLQFVVLGVPAANSFAAMAAGKAEVVQSSRRVLRSEIEALHSGQGKSYVELQVATEIAGITLNADNPVRELSLYELRQILSGEAKNWKQVGGNDAAIKIYGRDDSSGVRAFLEDEFMGDTGISSSAKTFPSNAAVLAAVSHDVNGVGFGNVDPRMDAHVKFVAIKPSASGEAFSPTGDAIRAKHYKLVRPLFFYFAGPPKGEILRFAEWVLSPEGQLVVEAQGYYPLSSSEREAGRQALSGGKP